MAESKASTNGVDSTSDIADAVNHLLQGKRHLLVQDYVSAVSSLQEACQLFAQKYGEAANECGEPYLYYGKALLELARMETGVLGNALEGVPTEEDESDSEDDQVESPDNITDDADAVEESNASNVDETKDDDADTVVESNTSNVDKTKDESEAGPSGLSEEKEEDVTNLQLGWEVLEIAKNIFKRQSETDKKMELKTAEVLLKLGEISIESENYKQAIEDLGECLRLQKCHLTPDDRAIAETYYQLGLANSFYGQFEDAIESFQKSMQVIEERIATLQQVPTCVSLDKKLDIGLEDHVEAAKREIEELQCVLPDIKSKIEDTEDLMKNSEVALKEAALQRLQEDTSAATVLETVLKEQDISKPTNNITHLLKRKRKSEGNADTNTEIDAKKHRSASGGHCSNGTAVTNGGSSTVQEADSLQNIESTA